MAAVTVRNIPDKIHRALKLRAARHGRSTEAEIRAILEAAVQPKVGVGSALRSLGRAVGGADLELQRDGTPTRGVDFG